MIVMGRPSKPMAKNSNSKYTPRNNKSDIFSKFTKKAEEKVDAQKDTVESNKETGKSNKETGKTNKETGDAGNTGN